jgi:hypothetical protein
MKPLTVSLTSAVLLAALAMPAQSSGPTTETTIPPATEDIWWEEDTGTTGTTYETQKGTTTEHEQPKTTEHGDTTTHLPPPTHESY